VNGYGCCCVASAFLALLPFTAEAIVTPAQADEVAHKAMRPHPQPYRWQEDWSVLADPALRTEPFDTLKYIPLSPTDPQSYISFGVNSRERFESNDAQNFGIGGVQSDNYVLQRLQWHIDMHFFENWELFTQFEDVRAFGKEIVGPADANELDLRVAFLGYTETFDAGTLKARVGRQEIAFDLQRFVSSRDGLNVRQAFDAAWAEWNAGTWRVNGFVSQPVEYHDEDPFDDESGSNLRFSALHLVRKVFDDSELSGYYALYQRDNAQFLDASGDEERHSLDSRFAGSHNGLDWDVEVMGQTGSVGDADVLAWAVGARAGYTFSDATWEPRLGVQFDAASGDHDSNDGTLNTFNPLFPNGAYFTLAGYTGYANLIHLRPSITVKPSEKLTVTGGVGFQWRQTTNDAVYVAPGVALTGTAGQGGLWTGVYEQLRVDYAINANLAAAAEYVHFDVGDSIRQAGGHDSNYFGGEVKFAW
jgi:hypothetical protein